VEQDVPEVAGLVGAKACRGGDATFRDGYPRMVEPPAVIRAQERTRFRVEPFAECAKSGVDCTDHDIERWLAHFGQPNQSRLLVDPRPLEMLRKEAERTGNAAVTACRIGRYVRSCLRVAGRLEAMTPGGTAAEATASAATWRAVRRRDSAARRVAGGANRQDERTQHHGHAPTARIAALATRRIGIGSSRPNGPTVAAQLPVPNCTICGVVLIVALPPDAVTDALPIHTPAVANSPHNTSPARPLLTWPDSRFCGCRECHSAQVPKPKQTAAAIKAAEASRAELIGRIDLRLVGEAEGC